MAEGDLSGLFHVHVIQTSEDTTEPLLILFPYSNIDPPKYRPARYHPR